MITPKQVSELAKQFKEMTMALSQLEAAYKIVVKEKEELKEKVKGLENER